MKCLWERVCVSLYVNLYFQLTGYWLLDAASHIHTFPISRLQLIVEGTPSCVCSLAKPIVSVSLVSKSLINISLFEPKQSSPSAEHEAICQLGLATSHSLSTTVDMLSLSHLLQTLSLAFSLSTLSSLSPSVLCSTSSVPCPSFLLCPTALNSEPT